MRQDPLPSNQTGTALPAITLTDQDVKRLTALLTTRVGLAYRDATRGLLRELRRATVVDRENVPDDLVTMNSTLSYREDDTDDIRSVTLVYPWRAHERSTLSVLTPIGTALLGLRSGTRVAWPLEDGSVKSLHVLAVTYQPEAAGHFHL
jgi:regulator of nucleoside diphosphate kinase